MLCKSKLWKEVNYRKKCKMQIRNLGPHSLINVEMTPEINLG